MDINEIMDWFSEDPSRCLKIVDKRTDRVLEECFSVNKKISHPKWHIKGHLRHLLLNGHDLFELTRFKKGNGALVQHGPSTTHFLGHTQLLYEKRQVSYYLTLEIPANSQPAVAKAQNQ